MAFIVALVLNLALFLIMPALIAVRPQEKEREQLDQIVTLTKVRDEQKKEKQKPPEKPKEKPDTLKPPPKIVMQRPKLSLPFELNSRLPSTSNDLILPPVDNSLPQADISGLFSVEDLDGQLMPLAQLPPNYPYTAKRRHIEGWVKIQFVVNKQGRVEDIRILKSEPEGTFDNAVQLAVSRWKFKPGTIGGTAVKTRVEQTIKFDLD